MDYYTPLFSKIVESSLWAESDSVVKMFVTLLAMKDADFVVRYTAFALGKKCWPKEIADGVAERRALEALKVLSEPDKTRVEPQPYEGRRIEKVADGYKILNGEFYHRQMQKINGRLSNADRQARHRERISNNKPRRSQATVRAQNESREHRFEDAHDAGDINRADAIAAEGT